MFSYRDIQVNEVYTVGPQQRRIRSVVQGPHLLPSPTKPDAIVSWVNEQTGVEFACSAQDFASWFCITTDLRRALQALLRLPVQ